MADVLSADKAQRIRNAIITDGAFVGSEMWLEQNNISKDDLMAFLDYGVRLAQMNDYRDSHLGEVGAIKFDGVTSKKLTVTKGKAVFSVDVDTSTISTDALQMFLDQEAIVHVYNKNLPLPFDEPPTLFDADTGEIL